MATGETIFANVKVRDGGFRSSQHDMKSVLTIAGFDPSSGAGVTADLMVFAAHELFGTSCITALTVQNTLGVRSTQSTQPETVAATLDCLYADIPPVGIKIGMLATAGIVSAVAAFLRCARRNRQVVAVLDPVLRSSSGSDLLDLHGIDTLRSELLPLVDWITPNVEEVGVLLGHRPPNVQDLGIAAADLQKLGTNLTVVITGGHLEPPDDLLLQANGAPEVIRGERILTSSTHGTGCAFSAALLSRLVLGDDPSAAVRGAKDYVAQAMRSAALLGQGRGPLNHLWPLRGSLNDHSRNR